MIHDVIVDAILEVCLSPASLLSGSIQSIILDQSIVCDQAGNLISTQSWNAWSVIRDLIKTCHKIRTDDMQSHADLIVEDSRTSHTI